MAIIKLFQNEKNKMAQWNNVSFSQNFGYEFSVPVLFVDAEEQLCLNVHWTHIVAQIPNVEFRPTEKPLACVHMQN